MTVPPDPTVLVLGGGPDAEREVSLVSARAVAEALGQRAHLVTIDTPTIAELRRLPGDVIFPVLHGPWGEGGPLQAMLERDGRPFVGSGACAARLAMDKLAAKLAAASAGIDTPLACLVTSDMDRTAGCPLELPVVVKPVCEGSSFGVHICEDDADWHRAIDVISQEPRRAWLTERYIKGRELTVGVVQSDLGSWRAMPIVEIIAAGGVYNHEAKYVRGDTVYVTDPDLPSGVGEQMAADAVAICTRLGIRHLSRVDFMLAVAPMVQNVRANFLEVNTMPGFTPSSLLPKACMAAGIDFASLCERLVTMASRVASGSERMYESVGLPRGAC